VEIVKVVLEAMSGSSHERRIIAKFCTLLQNLKVDVECLVYPVYLC